MAKDYCIGSNVWNGLAKVIEECGELQQVCGKLIGNEGGTNYWDDVDLVKKFTEEIGDLQAALDFFVETNPLDAYKIQQRRERKLKKFFKWNSNPEKYAGYKKKV